VVASADSPVSETLLLPEGAGSAQPASSASEQVSEQVSEQLK
jgi:hypothetical protein